MVVVDFAVIGFFGAAGAIGRHLLSNVGSRMELWGIPVGTLLVNSIGSLLLGLFIGITLQMEGLSPRWRLAIATGFLGSFTTFSTFSVETVRLFERGDLVAALANMGTQLGVGLVAAALGLTIARFALG